MTSLAAIAIAIALLSSGQMSSTGPYDGSLSDECQIAAEVTV